MLGTVLIASIYGFGFLAGVSGLLFGASYIRGQNKRYLLGSFVVCSAIAAGAGAWQTTLPSNFSALVPTQGLGGESLQKATLEGFRKELEDTAMELVEEAEDYFDAGERDYTANRFQDAATNYQKSVEVIPTMSGYLNLGNSLLNISDFAGAEKAATSGLRIARNRDDHQFQASFLGNVGLVYRHQGKLEEALKSQQAALTIMRKIGNRQGEANALGNIGLAHRNQGNLDEALESHRASLIIEQEIGNRLGEAKDLGNIGLVYRNQGKLKEALEMHHASLEIMQDIGNRLGGAQELGNIGNVYIQQGNLEAALGTYRASLAIMREIGNPLGEAQSLGNIGNVYFQNGELAHALTASVRARDIFQNIDAAIELQKAEENIARVQAEIDAIR